ncbi:MAG: THUMP domain-containing protein [Nanoarchaeota archaeon]|nr:hypothetical protein [Nanoarchaeota archaeon]MBU4452420.1 hypothetical protein [Nanoarchaeota archaeon]MCG2723894.1 THUMP domain-containing protein [archaeon]
MGSGSKLLLLRFGELWLKSFEVRRRFTDRLITNISEAFSAQKILFKAIKSHDRIFFEVPEKDVKKAAAILSRTFGLVSFSEVEEIETDRKKMTLHVQKIASAILSPKDTFAMRVKRTGTHAFGSQELERELGADVVRKFGNKVDLTRPDKTISVEIRDNKTYLFSETVPSLGGLPLGVEGKVAVLFSKDYEKSIVSAFLMMKRGCKVFAIFVKSRLSKKEKDAVALLSKYDPIIRYALIKSEKSAFKEARKNKARALVIPDTLAETLARKTSRFDKKTGVFALEPLIGFDEKKLKEMYRTISLVR